jgi:hypothetical protein
MRVEEAQLPAAVHGVEGVVDIERDPLRDLAERLAIEVDQGASHAQQGARVGEVFETRDGRLPGEFAIGRREALRHLEHGIAAQSARVVAVLAPGADRQQTKTDDVGETVSDEVLVARIATTVLPETADRPGSGKVGSFMASVVGGTAEGFGFDNRTLRQISSLYHSRQPMMNFPG